MIRLIDCEVYAVEREDITRSGLFSFFAITIPKIWWSFIRGEYMRG